MIYRFGEGKADGSIKLKKLLGGKGAGLAEMTNLGIPVPPGFTITTEVCRFYFQNKKYPAGLEREIDEALAWLEKVTGKKFGDKENPLLVSVRSGAAVSMPGMMDTILNLGLTEETLVGLAEKSNNPRFAWDAYRRLIQMFGNVVDGIEHKKFEHILEEVKEAKGVKEDTELDVEDLKEIVRRYKELYKIEKKEGFPDEARQQLNKAIEAVFKSWSNPRAVTYRKINRIDENEVFGTAVNVQAMVFGNMGEDCGTGVAFTRNPSTGEKVPYGEYLPNAQGEDVVAGIRTPMHLDELKQQHPDVYRQLTDVFEKLEKHFRDMQDLEFTVEHGKLYLLQTRTGKRTAAAAVKIAVDMTKEGLIDEKEALLRVDPEQINQLLHPTLDGEKKKEFAVIAKGLPASPGAVWGEVVFSAEEAVEAAEENRKVILVRTETSPEDIAGMNAAEGILTARGGMTSHAAVVARGMGKCCVVGCEEIAVSEKGGFFQVGDRKISRGEVITLDGSTGEVFLGKVPTVAPSLSGDFATLMSWADKYRRLGVRTNADTPKDAQIARDLGAEGIGLCRTEHMFFEEDRIFAVRQMILAENKEQRQQALAKIFPMQKEDFKQLFEIMKGLPVKIRLLDPPLHEFLPKKEEDFVALAEEMGVSPERVKRKAEELFEFNPMMGHRGCRLGITFPEIYQMQVRAIIEAACELKKEKGMTVEPEIMIPLVGHINELKKVKEFLLPVIEEAMEKQGVKVKFQLGTMIEVPRAAVTAGEIAKEAEFFSFGTNDLTQMTFGFSRDDSGKFIKVYLEEKILPADPFRSIDEGGVGKLMEWTVKEGKKSNPQLEIGICGEQGGDPQTIYFCHRAGLDYVSCSPYRVPVARLAAAQAAIQEE
ncbi:pyruvate, phosphate dikinase [bacterium]|nr:pyruvate, phosphate dikinase [bacterium]